MKFNFKKNFKKKLIILIGLPNSGTTITNSYINSMDNGVSISEFFQHIAYNKPGMLRFDKLDNDINSLAPLIKVHTETKDPDFKVADSHIDY